MRTLLLLAFAGAALASPAVDSTCDRAAFLFFNRHLAPANLDSAYRMLERARSQEPDNERCLYLWSRIHIQKGDMAKDKGSKLECYARALAIAESLKTLNDRNPYGHMWWGVAQGRIGQTRGVMNSLFMVPSLKRAFNRTLELDSRHTTAYDAYGVLYYELPGIVGGSLARSEEYLLKGIELDPNYTVIRLDLAKVYVKQKRWTEAREQLETLIATTDPTFPADFVLDDRPEAMQLLMTLPPE
jgi:tetratricopeptide (TPR) repeat protein